MSKKILLSGVKPTGRPHIGNYFGAMKQFVDLQDDYKCYFMIADYHALNSIQNREEMNENIYSEWKSKLNSIKITSETLESRKQHERKPDIIYKIKFPNH